MQTLPNKNKLYDTLTKLYNTFDISLCDLLFNILDGFPSYGFNYIKKEGRPDDGYYEALSPCSPARSSGPAQPGSGAAGTPFLELCNSYWSTGLL